MEKSLKSSADVQVMKNWQQRQKKQSMRCIRQFWMQDGMENGSFVHMMRSPKKLDQKSVRKEKSLLNRRAFVLWQVLEKKRDWQKKHWILYMSVWKQSMES